MAVALSSGMGLTPAALPPANVIKLSCRNAMLSAIQTVHRIILRVAAGGGRQRITALNDSNKCAQIGKAACQLQITRSNPHMLKLGVHR